MAAIWPNSLQPYGAAFNGAKARFYTSSATVGTSTPLPVYTTAELSTTHDQPVEADNGIWPAIFFDPSVSAHYRVNVDDADDVDLWDVSGISVPQDADYEPPDTGETSETLLFRTGMRVGFYGTTAPSGWVRAAGRTIGSASSGATERANADCEDLFEHLWNSDANLTVSSGRGANAAADWAANKTITLPDYRERLAAGMATMGNSAAGRIADTLVDGGSNSSTLGATAGASTVTLTSAQIPAHTHTGSGTTGDDSPDHTHGVSRGGDPDVGTTLADGTHASTVQTGGASTRHQHPFSFTTDANTGGGGAHANVQPSIFELVIIKL